VTTSQKVQVSSPAPGKTDLQVTLGELQTLGIDGLLAKNPDLKILRVDHAALNSGDLNLLDLAMKFPHVRATMISLANRGFFVYMLKEQTTSLVHFRHIAKLWKRVSDGNCRVDDNGLIYSLEVPLAGHAPAHLLVVFSSIADKIRTSSLMRHFFQNYSTVQKYVPAGTAVLRIADFGGVVGGFYLNSYGFPDTESHVQSLIARVTEEIGLTSDQVVLYGTSKGGSASLYHGVLGGYRVVSVDPILADEHYIKRFRDCHFTVGTFPEDKRDKFERLSSTTDSAKLAPTAIICSDRSPQFPYIATVLREPLKSHVAYFNSRHPDIKVHPDVGVKTRSIAIMLINMMFYRLPVSSGMYVVDDLKHREDTRIPSQ